MIDLYHLREALKALFNLQPPEPYCGQYPEEGMVLTAANGRMEFQAPDGQFWAVPLGNISAYSNFTVIWSSSGPLVLCDKYGPIARQNLPTLKKGVGGYYVSR